MSFPQLQRHWQSGRLMRRLRKGPRPAVLDENFVNWTHEFLETENPSRYARHRHREIRRFLKAETCGKCAYCESRIEHVASVHVEHINPKSQCPELVVEWENLTLACPNCNQHKGSYYSELQPLLNPYEVEPRAHLTFTGSLVFGRPDSDLGKRTVERLKLHRNDLKQSREERLKAINHLLSVWAKAEGEDKETFAGLLREEAGPDREYSEAVTSFLVVMGFPLELILSPE